MATTTPAVLPAGKKVCLTDSRFTYTGKESSPRGLGYCAEAEVIGTKKEGRDKTMWMVIMKNAVNVWTRVPTEILQKDTPLIPATPKSAETTPKKTAAKKKTSAQVEPDEKGVESPEATPAKVKKTTAKTKKEVKTEVKTEVVKEPVPVEEAPDAETPKSPVQKTKKAATKKAAVKESEPEAKTPKTKKPPSDFNVYMKYRIAQLAESNPGMAHKDKFGTAAKDWGALTPEQKTAEVVKARAAGADA